MTRAKVFQIGLIVFLLGGLGYEVFKLVGFESISAGIAAQSILHDLLDLIHQLALPVLALAHPLVHRVEDVRHVENNLTLPH